jgi:hypothetical protein
MTAISAVLLISTSVKEGVEVTLVGDLDLQEPATSVRVGVNL